MMEQLNNNETDENLSAPASNMTTNGHDESVDLHKIMKSTSKTTWDQLPAEIWLHIFKFLPHTDILYHVSEVCELFRVLRFDVDLWKNIDLTEWNNNEIELIFDILIIVDQENVRKLTLVDYFIEFSSINSLSKFTNLIYLNVGHCNSMTNEGVLFVAQNCRYLQTLILQNCNKIKDVGMKYISDSMLNLKTLDISHCNAITNVGFCFLGGLKPKLLHFLSDGCLHVNETGISSLIRDQRQLETLTLDGENLTDSSVHAVTSLLPNLNKFCLSFCELLTNDSLSRLQKCTNLQTLHLKNLKNDAISTMAFVRFFDCEFFNLKELVITTCFAVTNEVLHSVAKTCKKLQHIRFDWCWAIGDQGIKELIKNCNKLNFISLIGVNELKGAWISDIETKLPDLKYLDCTMCDFIEDDVIYLLTQRNPDITGHGYYGQKITYNIDKDSLMIDKRLLKNL